MNSKTINLILPGLFAGFQPSELETSAVTEPFLIQRLLSKADAIFPAEPATEVFSADYLKQYPLAFYEYVSANKEATPAQTVFYATPVSLDLKSDHIVAMPLSTGADNLQQLARLVDKCNQHFEEDGLLFHLLPSGTIIGISSQHAAAQMIPVYDVYGRDIKHFLPKGENAKFWLRLFNETQMLLHEYFDLNERIYNQKELNSFWFWGAAENNKQASLSAAFVGKPEWLKGYCQFNHVKHYAFDEITKHDDETLYLIDESLLAASSCGDFTAWKNALRIVEAELLAPLYQLLKSGDISQINFHSPTVCYQLKRSHRFRFYRKNKTIMQLCVKSHE
ncbi:MAG: hypothetical protein OEY11_09740 [Gammaproteobacteria bacterium]|nr:hypothetical protein [Gammaproteobacteria bacterium]